MRPGDLISEALTSLSTRPIRAAATALGTILGVAALIGITGVATTAQRQVTDRFDLLQATEVVANARGELESNQIEDRLDRIEGVVASGVYVTGDLTDVALPSVSGPFIANVPVVAASAGFFDAREIEVISGRLFDRGHVSRADHVVVLGKTLGEQLGVTGVTTAPPVLSIGGTEFVVLGVVADAPRMLSAANSVIVPLSTRPPAETTSVVARTDLGGAVAVADVMDVAILPEDPESVVVIQPPAVQDYVAEIETDLRRAVTAAGWLALGLGMLGIASVTSVSVVERTAEIGLRLALGAKRRHVAGQVIVESAVIGVWGGLLGLALGVIAVVAVSAANSWSPHVGSQLLLVAPILGLAIRVVAGAIPAFRAASIQPDRALRSD